MSASGTASIYVGDLADEVSETDLHNTFSRAGTIVSVNLCRDTLTGRFKNYGYVNYAVPQDARRAVDRLNHVVIKGRAARVMPSQRDAAARRSGIANLFVKNLHPELVTNKVLHDHFSQCGVILSAKVATDSARRSRGYGFVQFADPEAARQARDTLHSTELCGQILHVSEFMPAKDRAASPGKFFNIYVKNIGSATTEGDLMAAFSGFGPITSAVVMTNSQGRSRGFGFVNFMNSDDAVRAVGEMDGYVHNGLKWKVDRARRREEGADGRINDRLDRTNLSVKKLSPNCTEAQLRAIFEEFGPVDSIKVIKGPSGLGKGNAFVQFQHAEDAEAAITNLNGRQILENPLPISVSLAPRRRPPSQTEQQGMPLLTQADLTPGQGTQGSSSSVYSMPPLQPLLAHPGIAYYPGPPMFYGHPVAVPQSQQQGGAAYLQPSNTPRRHLLDPMSGLAGIPVAVPASSIYPGQGDLTQLGIPYGIPPMMRYEASLPAPPQYWHDPTGNRRTDNPSQDGLYRSRSRVYQQRPVSPVPNLGNVSPSLGTSWGRSDLPSQALTQIESSALTQAQQALARTRPDILPFMGQSSVAATQSAITQAEEALSRTLALGHTSALPNTTMFFPDSSIHDPVSSSRQGDEGIAQSNLLGQTAGLFTTEAGRLFQDDSLSRALPSTTSGSNN